MKIVILDGYTLNPGDLSWAPLQELGQIEVHDRTTTADVLTRCADAEIVLTNKVVLNAETIAALPKLRYIGVLATGFNVVDAAAAAARGIPVTNVPGYSTASVVQHTFALMLELALRVGGHADSVKAGGWSGQPDFSYWDGPLVELAGKTLGIVGYGTIGKGVAKVAEALGMQVVVASRSTKTGVQQVTMDALFATADIISLHCPLTAETQSLVNAARLATMKPSAWLINTGRGPLIDESALAEALNTGKLAAAALDVLSQEPPHAENPLLKASNCRITPHQAWATQAARQRLMSMAAENLQAFLAGNPQNVVNPI